MAAAGALPRVVVALAAELWRVLGPLAAVFLARVLAGVLAGALRGGLVRGVRDFVLMTAHFVIVVEKA